MSARRRSSSKKPTNTKGESFQNIGKTMSVISFLVTILLGLFITMTSLAYIILASQSVRVKAMIHSKQIVNKAKCGGTDTVCVGLVFTHKSQDYTVNMELPDTKDLVLGKTVDLFVDVKDPTDTNRITFYLPFVLLPWAVVGWVIALLVGIVLIVLAFYKISVNMSNPIVADATGRYHLSSLI